VVPAIIIVTVVTTRWSNHYTTDLAQAYAPADQVALQTFRGIRTVLAIGGVEKLVDSYR
jgi:hypothetical protein